MGCKSGNYLDTTRKNSYIVSPSLEKLDIITHKCGQQSIQLTDTFQQQISTAIFCQALDDTRHTTAANTPSLCKENHASVYPLTRLIDKESQGQHYVTTMSDCQPHF